MEICQSQLDITLLGIEPKIIQETEFWACVLTLIQIPLILIAGVALLLFRSRNYCCNRKKALGIFQTLRKWLQKAINNSVAVYISENHALRTIFFIFGNFACIFGFTLFAISSRVFQHSSHIPKRFSETLLGEVIFVMMCHVTSMQLFLLVLVGAKSETFKYTRNPIRSITMTIQERKSFVRSSLKRMLILSVMVYFIPESIRIIVFAANFQLASQERWWDVSYIMSTGFVFYFSVRLIGYLKFEKESNRMHAKYSASALKINSVTKFFAEHGPLSTVKSYLSKKGVENEVHTVSRIKEIIESQANVLNERLDIIDNDSSVPMPINTGEISILGKIMIILGCLIDLPLLAVLLSAINVPFLISFSNLMYKFTTLISLAGMLFLYPLVTVPFFSSHMMFDSKNFLQESNNSQQEEQDFERNGREENESDIVSNQYHLLGPTL